MDCYWDGFTVGINKKSKIQFLTDSEEVRTEATLLD